MKAIIFAAGKGTRLKPFTDSHPKALAPVNGECMLGRVIDKLIDAGADGIVVNVHHFASQIVDFLAQQNYGVPIEISDESCELLETGGALAKIARESKLLAGIPDSECIIIHNSDILTDFPLSEFYRAATGVEAAILVDPSRQTSRKFLFNGDGLLRGWINENTGALRPDGINPEGLTRAAFGGVHCVHRSILDRISDYCGPELHPFGVVDFYMDICTCGDMVKAYTPAGEFLWFDIGTAEHLEQAQSINL